jgi:RNA polymerase sigma-70 factor (ECF subfamily)
VRETPAGAPELVAASDARAPGGFGNERSAALWAAVDRLPEKLRVVIVLAAIEGHDVREVASILGVPEGTVKSRLFAARQRLREALA